MTALTNRDIANIFDIVADMLEIRGDVIHRVLSYRRAAETVRDLPRDLRAVAAEGGLEALPNIGKTLAAKIIEMLETGRLEFYDKLAQEIPPGLVEVMRVSGVGPKRARLFWQQLGVTGLAELEAAARAGKLRDLPGMGEKSERKIVEGIEALARQTGRTPLGVALPAAQTILDALLALPQAVEGSLAGSIRRGRPTVGDVDILIASPDPEAIMARFVALDNVARVLAQGSTKSSVELVNGLQVDLRVLEPARWGTALSYFTGSKDHNVRLRELALQRGLSLNEHAFSPVDTAGNVVEGAQKILCANEEEVYAVVGLPWIPPELREDSGEIEAALAGTLPQLISLDDVRADLHMHTTWSDGTLSVRQMAHAARARGRQYIVITDHSQYSTVANGLSVERIMQQQEEVRRVDAEMGPDFRVFHGVELDIRADGALDYPDDVLARLDFVIASLHYSLRQERAQITKRLLNAISNPHVDLIGHPRAQYIPDREPVDADMDAVFAAAAQRGTALEINANPRRLDLDAQHARRAVELRIPLAINTDAHSAEQMDLLHFGVLTARRGWVQAADVINTWPVEQFEAWLESRNSSRVP